MPQYSGLLTKSSRGFTYGTTIFARSLASCWSDPEVQYTCNVRHPPHRGSGTAIVTCYIIRSIDMHVTSYPEHPLLASIYVEWAHDGDRYVPSLIDGH